MVERLKIAVDKARNGGARGPKGQLPPRAAQARAGHPQLPATITAPLDAWQALEPVSLDPAHLRRNRVVSHDKGDPAHMAFDLLRTRLLKVFRDNGWSRLAITSPTKGCGKTVVSANLALSMARQRDCKTLLVDANLRAPGLARCFGVEGRHTIEWFLQYQTVPEGYLQRVGDTLALGLNSERVRDSAELMQSELAGASLARAIAQLEPDVVIYDLPAMLDSDDAIAFLPNVDCVLLVAAAGQTRPAEIDTCERLLAESTHFLGVLLNKSAEKANRGA